MTPGLDFWDSHCCQAKEVTIDKVMKEYLVEFRNVYVFGRLPKECYFVCWDNLYVLELLISSSSL